MQQTAKILVRSIIGKRISLLDATFVTKSCLLFILGFVIIASLSAMLKSDFNNNKKRFNEAFTEIESLLGGKAEIPAEDREKIKNEIYETCTSIRWRWILKS